MSANKESDGPGLHPDKLTKLDSSIESRVGTITVSPKTKNRSIDFAVLDMGRRWSVREENALTEVKRRLKDQLANRPQFPEGQSSSVNLAHVYVHCIFE